MEACELGRAGGVHSSKLRSKLHSVVHFVKAISHFANCPNLTPTLVMKLVYALNRNKRNQKGSIIILS